MPSSSDYTNRIVDEAHRVIDPRTSALQAAFDSLRSHLLTSLDQLAPKLDELKGVELPGAERIVTEAMKEAAWQNQVEVNLLAEFAGGMRRKETQEEILSLLLDTAEQFAHAVALFVARGDEIAGWSSRGFNPETAARFGSSTFGAGESAILRKALMSDLVVSFDHPPEEERLEEIFRGEPLTAWHLLPMKALQRPIAVLAACDTEDRHANLDSLRILMDFTSLSVENLALKILQELRTTEAPVPESASRPAETVTPPQTDAKSSPPPEHEPSTSAEEPEAPPENPIRMRVPATQEAEEEIESAQSFAEPAPSLHPSESPEPIESADLAAAIDDAFAKEKHAVPVNPVREPARETASAPVTTATQVVTQPTPAPVSPEVEKLQADARRFARLLVSEIKLYNEQRLLEARAGGQIYLRLKRDIDRSREMYEKRFPSAGSHKVDFFHDEIVRILAENDSAKLGAEYPGPRVES